MSKATCELLVNKIIDGGYLNTHHHSTIVGTERAMHKATRLDQEGGIVREFGSVKPALEEQYQHASSSGHWLLTTPNRLNGSQLSAKEFRNNLRLRENLKPLDMPQLCDGCRKRTTVDHALLCKCGGLVHIRHDDVGKEWESLSVCAFSQGALSHEPYIYGANRHTCENETVGANISPNLLINTPTP